MHRLMTVFSNVTSVFQTIVVQAPIMRIVFVSALGVGLALATSSRADDRENSDKPRSSASSAIERTPDPEQRLRDKNDRSGDDDSVRHHGALGVLLSKSEDVVTVVGVIPGSPAERAGLRLGDEIRYVGDRRIRTTQELTEEIRESKPGTEVDLSIRRSGRRQIVTANLATQESTFGSRDVPTNTGSGQSSGLLNRGDQQTNRSRGPNSTSNGSHGAQVRAPQQPLNQRIGALERQIYLLNQELNELRRSQSVNAQQTFDLNAWWDRVHHGDSDNDGALFQ
jgi:membrane-associated protease RseP (regulator of RpoE activity)